jgi:iron-sulfur cluster repair protein YtfE (RIC family)
MFFRHIRRETMTHPFIEHLKKDHEKQRTLGEKLRNAKDPEQRETLRQQFHEALYPHMIGEEASFFDYMKSTGEKAGEEARKGLQEHHVAKVVLRELMDLTLESNVFSAKAYVLDELNRHHMKEEEKTHFPMLERIATKEKLDTQFDRYKEAEKDVKSS